MRIELFVDILGFELVEDSPTRTAAYRRMRDSGVRFLTAPRREPYGDVAVFLDIAGNRWDLLGPPADPPDTA